MLTTEQGGPLRPTHQPRVRGRRDLRGAFFDLVAVGAVVILVMLGLLNLDAIGERSLAAEQLTAVGFGLVLLVAFLRLGPRFLPVLAAACYGLALLLLGAVHVGGLEVYGAQRWLAVGQFTFQPSELAKLALLLTLASVLGTDWPASVRFAVALVLAVPPIGFTLVQPDLGTSFVLMVLAVALLIMGRIPLRFLLPLFTAAALVAPFLVGVLRPYQLARLQAFVSRAILDEGPGWAVMQAHIALASGGLLGMRDDPRYQVLAEYLPGRHHDLALASLVSAWGLIAGALALVAALVLVWRLALAGRSPRTAAGGLVAGGLAVLIGVQVMVSLGGNLGLLPLTGIPFPLVSLGGTALAVNLAALGVALGVRHDGVRRRLWTPMRWRSPRPRLLRTAALALTATLAGFAAYGWQLQETRGAALREAGEQQMLRCIRIPAPRGEITDRHGEPLAADAREDHVLAIPGLVHRPEDVARLATLVEQPEEALRASLNKAGDRMSVRVAVVPRATGARVAEAEMPGVVVGPSPRRVYPHGELLGPMLGFVGVATPEDADRWPGLPLGEFVGRAGVEQQYDPVLRGVDGRLCVYVDPPGRPVRVASRREPVPGADLRLSLDLGLQEKLTAELGAAMGSSGGDVGGAVLMDPRSGQVLAMASLPSYDNNLYGPPVDAPALREAQQAPGHPTLEHVTQVNGPPGSVFKLVTASAGAVHRVFQPSQVIPTGGAFTYGGHTFANWRSFGGNNLMQAIAWSDNVYFYKLALGLGPDRIHEVATELGAGRRTGIDLPGESSGYVGTPATVQEIGENWYGGSTVILGIGQGYVSVTPLQAALWTGSIATGQRVTPRLGLAFGAPGGPLSALPAPAPARLPFADALGPVREGMRQAATYGTAAGLSTLPVQAGGKTGSAEDPASPIGRTHSWYTAVAPLDDPVVVAASFVRGGGFGARTSGPVVVEALRYFLDNQDRIFAEPKGR